MTSRLKETDEDRRVREEAYSNTGAQLLGFIEAIERHEAAKAQEQDEIKAIYENAHSQGFDKKAIRVIVAERRADKEKLAELQALLDTYRAALGM